MSSSIGARVFRGCRALLAPAATKAKTATVAKPKLKPTPKPKPKPTPTTSTPRTTAITKPIPVSSALGDFLGSSEASRAEAVKKIWAYIKSHDLQNPSNKREIFCDDKLKTIFAGKDKVGFLEIGKLLSPHFVKTA